MTDKNLFNETIVQASKAKVTSPASPREIIQNEKKKRHPDYISAISIRPCYSVIFSVRADGLPPSRNGFSQPRLNKPEGMISKKAATKINNAMQWLLMFSPRKRVYSKKSKKSFSFRINFITLTLSGTQVHTDEFIKEHMLYPFLRWMGRSHNAKLYLWKAESQKNGNIHFHITTNTFIHWKSIRKKWNSIQGAHGYLKKWTNGNEVGDPNATDVHSVRDEDQVANYMVKYMLKNDETRRKITGRLWACSPELSRMKIYSDQHEPDFGEIADCLASQGEVRKLDHAELILHNKLSRLNLSNSLRSELSRIYQEIKPKLNQQKFFTIE